MTAVLEPTETAAAAAAPGAPPAAPAVSNPSALALHAEDVTVRFGGLVAVDNVSLEIYADEIVGLIGGNGAGKTTFMNVVSGYVQPDGDATLTAFGQDLLGMPPEYRPYVDVGRSYQAATLFPGLSVIETLLVAVERHEPTPILGAILGTGKARRIEQAKRERVDELIESCGLQVYADRLVRELSTGTRRVVDLACILAQRPGLLLLDEPTGGLAQRETEAFAPLIRRVQRQLGCAVMVIEHDMVMIGELCDRVYAMETGRVISTGTPDEVRNDPLVIASYLGTDQVAINRSGAGGERTDAVVTPAEEPATNGQAVPRKARRQLVAGPDLHACTRTELLALARTAQIRGRSSMRKAELVAALEAESIGATGLAPMTAAAETHFRGRLDSLVREAEAARATTRREGGELRPLGERAAKTRDALLAAGIEVFCEQGYAASTVADVHDRAGVSLGTFYQYFRDKTDLVRTIVAETVLLSTEGVFPAIDTGAGRTTIGPVVRGFVSNYAATAPFQRVWEEVTLLEPAVAEFRRRLTEVLELSLADAIEVGQADGSIDPALDPRVAARALSAMVDRSCFLTFVVDDRSDDAVPEVCDTLALLWANALGLAP